MNKKAALMIHQFHYLLLKTILTATLFQLRTHRTRSINPKGCPPGIFRGTGMSLCTECPAGYWKFRYTSSFCAVCPIGHPCANASLAPTPCPLGTANPSLGQIDCFLCPAGSYTPTRESPTCAVCPQRHFCHNDAQMPKKCPPGNNERGERERRIEDFFCRIGTLGGSGQMNCTICPMGYYNIQNRAGQCINCPAGHHRAEAAGSPVPCPPGTFEDQHGQVTCPACGQDNYLDILGQVACFVCPAGSECSDGAIGPIPYPPGTFSAAGKTVCAPCLTGHQTTLNGSRYCGICGPGHSCPTPDRAPIHRPPGFAQINPDQVVCDKCSPGSSADKPGTAICLLCPAGWVCDDETRRAPRPCPDNRFLGQSRCFELDVLG